MIKTQFNNSKILKLYLVAARHPMYSLSSITDLGDSFLHLIASAMLRTWQCVHVLGGMTKKLKKDV